MKKSKKLLSWLLVVALAISMVATFSLAKEAEKVTIRFSTWQWEEPGYKDFLMQSTQAFMDEHPNIKIEPFYYPWGDLWDKLIVEAIAGNPPDLIMTYHGNQHDYSKMRLLAPLDERIAEANLNDILQDFQQTFPVYQGKTYAVCLAARTEQLIVNNEIFNNQNVKIPTNYDEFVEAANKLTSKKDKIYGLSITTSDCSRLYEAALLFTVANGGNFVKDGKPTVNDPLTIKGVQLYKDFLDAGVIPPGTDHSTSQKYFFEGKAAMLFAGPWIWATMEEQSPEILDKISFLDNPFPNNVALGGPNNLLGIAEGSEHKDEAWEYIKFISNIEWGRKWLKLTKSPSAVKGAISEDYLAENPWYNVYINGLSHAVQVVPEGLETQAAIFTKTVRNHLMEILYNNKDVKEEMDKCQAELESVLVLE
jgi:multiple sugar transport system substrate-binding protein